MSDSYATLSWLKNAQEQQLFVDGIYPQGIIIYSLISPSSQLLIPCMFCGILILSSKFRGGFGNEYFSYLSFLKTFKAQSFNRIVYLQINETKVYNSTRIQLPDHPMIGGRA